MSTEQKRDCPEGIWQRHGFATFGTSVAALLRNDYDAGFYYSARERISLAALGFLTTAIIRLHFRLHYIPADKSVALVTDVADVGSSFWIP